MFLNRASFSLVLMLVAMVHAGDRNPDYTITYPAGALIQNEGCVYDITNPPTPELTAGVGDGVTDDHQAFVDAIDYVLQLMDNGRPYSDEQVIKNPDGVYTIYLPNGTYKVTQPITYTGPTRFDSGRTDRNENFVGIKFVGQDRDSTIVRLAPSSPGFNNSSAPKALFVFARPDCNFNNWPAKSHGCRNLTIDVANNTGAVGIDYWSANSGFIMNVGLRADAGCGAIGIHFRIAVAAGYFQDITVDNFAYGIKSDGTERASHPVFEHITLNGQRSAAFSITAASTTIRDLLSSTSATAVELKGNSAQVILLESTLENGSSQHPALSIASTGHLFARDVSVSGYTTAIRKGAENVHAGDIEEYTSHSWRFTRDSTRSLNLPIEDVPIVPYAEPTEWVMPDGFDGPSVQAAFNLGKPVVYFPSKTEYNTGEVTVPAHVQRIEGFGNELRGTLTIAGISEEPIVIAGLREVTINNESPRTVVLYQSGGWGEVKNNGTKQKWHLCNIGQIKIHNLTNARVWGRWINAEGVRYLTINNCEWVQMGYKSERQENPGVQIENASVAELLGGTFGVHNTSTIVRIGEQSQATILANNSGNYDATDPAIIDVGHDSLYKEEFPERTSSYRFWMLNSIDSSVTTVLNEVLHDNQIASQETGITRIYDLRGRNLCTSKQIFGIETKYAKGVYVTSNRCIVLLSANRETKNLIQGTCRH